MKLYELTSEEIISIKKYQVDDFKIMNSLLRQGLESEVRINSSNSKSYQFMTRSLMEQSLEDIKNLYSAIIKSYMKNGSQKPGKQLFRGTQDSLIESMKNNASSFLSATTNINQTLTFSRTYNKASYIADDFDKAVMLIDGNVPWLSIENEIGGLEDEVLFVPAKMHISEKQFTTNQKYGKEYTVVLSEIDIPEKTPEEIEQMRNAILHNTEKMSKYLKYILVVKDNPNFSNNPRTLSLINEYNDWKKLVVEYNHQQYKIIKNKFINNPNLYQDKEENLKDQREIIDYIKQQIEQVKRANLELIDLSEIISSREFLNNPDTKQVEKNNGNKQK